MNEWKYVLLKLDQVSVGSSVLDTRELPEEKPKKIYESPDGGKTVYERDFGKTERKLVETDDPEPERYYDWMLWKFRQERKKRNS